MCKIIIRFLCDNIDSAETCFQSSIHADKYATSVIPLYSSAQIPKDQAHVSKLSHYFQTDAVTLDN